MYGKESLDCVKGEKVAECIINEGKWGFKYYYN